ncbi:MAG: DUF4834 family protein [Tannerella sp.]|jgi:hypothetical protein|nr:DUF4834 family protein [Tannerella sp.]
MFKFLVFLFMFFLILVSLLGFSALRAFKAILFGNPKKRTQSHASSAGRRRPQNNPSRPSRRKIISKEEGEYIDYEEVND